ncbi:MAG: protein kinase [Acidobacteria bacterium]|nr:protein kinase [Acidobacteriota bacterium]
MVQRIGKYEIVETLGKGAMGVVYKGYDRRLDRGVAIKTMFGHLTEDRDAYERFLKEAQALARLHHPNIVAIHDMDEENGSPYIVMELLEGQDLKQLMTASGRLPHEQVVDLVAQAASGLECAHKHGIVHRDVKPANLFVTADGTVKLVDFGVARLLQGLAQTRAGVAVGTATYMSPEQARGERVEAPSDQFSLGVIAYELLRGEVPFKAETLTGVLMKIITEPPPPLTPGQDRCSAEMAATVMRALDKFPERRFASVTAFADAFRASLSLAQRGPATPFPTLLAGDTARVATQAQTEQARGARTVPMPPGGPTRLDASSATRTYAIAPPPAPGPWTTPPPYLPPPAAPPGAYPPPAGFGPPSGPVPAPAGVRPPAPARASSPRARAPRRSPWPWVLLGLLGVGLAAGAVILFFNPFGGTGPTPPADPGSPGSGPPPGTVIPSGGTPSLPGGTVAPPGGSVTPPGGDGATGAGGSVPGTGPGTGLPGGTPGGDTGPPPSPTADLMAAIEAHSPGAVPGTQALLLVAPALGIPDGAIHLMQKDGGRWRAVDSIRAGVGKVGLAPPGLKREGDQRVPSGSYALGPAFGYAPRADTAMEYIAVTDQDYWVVNPVSPRYNRPLRSPRPLQSRRELEKLRRADEQYALALVVQYNMHPVRAGLGSAIFLCLSPRPGARVSGCVTLDRPDMERLLRWLDPRRSPRIILGVEDSLRRGPVGE